MLNIAIYGAGSMGTALGAFLSRADIAADLVSRDKEHIKVLKTDGAKIQGTFSFSTPPFDGKDGRGLAMLPAEMKKKYTVIFLLTKQNDNAATAKKLKDFLTPDGIVCTLQNGIPEPALAEILGMEKVYGGVCMWGAEKPAPGVVAMTSDPAGMNFSLGRLGESPQDFDKPKPYPIPHIKIVLEKMCPVTMEHNFIGVRWSKLLINAAFSGMSAVTGWNFGKIADNRIARRYALDVINECIAVCKAADVKMARVQGKDITRLMDISNPLKNLRANIILPIAMKKHRTITSGMLRDLEKGRPCEIEYINGTVSKWGKEHGVPTPANDKIIEIVHSIERGERKCGERNLALLARD